VKQFRTIETVDTVILYTLELTSSISVLLLAFGLIASMANVLTEGSVLTDNTFMQRVWAWTQCIAIDASVAGAIIRTFRYHAQKERIKCILHALLSGLLLFTAAIVSNIESVQQTLNLSLEASYGHVFIPVEALIWIRSLAIVLLIVAHALRHVQQEPERTAIRMDTSRSVMFTPEQVDALRTALAQITVTEESQQALPAPQDEQETNTDESEGEQRANAAQEANVEQGQDEETNEGEQEVSNYERVKAYLARYPAAKDREIADALAISSSTANKWRKRMYETSTKHEQL
jgi:cytochrome c oxidase subunit IV